MHPDNITLTAIAADTDGNVSRVEFWNGNVKLGQNTTSTTVSVIPLKLDFAGFTSNDTAMLHTQIPAGWNYTISYIEDFKTQYPLQSSTAHGLSLDHQDPAAGARRFYQLKVEP